MMIKEAVKVMLEVEDHQRVLTEYTKAKFIEKFGNKDNVLLGGYTILDENHIRIMYLHLDPEFDDWFDVDIRKEDE